MNFSTLCNRIFWEATVEYRRLASVDEPMRNPYKEGSVEAKLFQKCWIDNVQWDLEDIIRDPHIDPVEALAIKRRIDASNQRRTDVVESIDDYFLAQYAQVVSGDGLRLNTESPAWAVDRLSILTVKIYMMQRQANDLEAEESHRAKCQTKLDVLLEQRGDLSRAMDELLADYAAGRKVMKVYRQMKMYNDPSLNPILRGEKH